ncbi:MAG: peptidylprolyl isomerase [Thermus sp.]|uniref:peptidylprolyl isomerase n=1 Tax=Thermus sp. TaxID=275 RepID=UPI0030AC3AD6
MRLFLALFLALGLALAQENVVAQVGPEAITKEAFELRYGLFIKSALGQLGLPDTEETRALLAQYRAPYLEALAEERALLLRAQREGLFPKEEEVEARVQELRGAFPSEEAFLEALRGAGLPDLPTYRTLLREALALEALEARYRARLQVSPAALRFLYHLNPPRRPALACARHILVPTLEEAKDLLNRLERGASFAELAQAHSQDPGSAPQGGALGCEARGAYVPPFDQALWALRPGEVSAPVRTEFGYHLILLERLLPAGRVPLEEVAEELKAPILDRAWERLSRALIRPYPIRIFPERL